jgi:hypothetical protein
LISSTGTSFTSDLGEHQTVAKAKIIVNNTNNFFDKRGLIFLKNVNNQLYIDEIERWKRI